jgi:hypothetical protein
MNERAVMPRGFRPKLRIHELKLERSGNFAINEPEDEEPRVNCGSEKRGI